MKRGAFFITAALCVAIAAPTVAQDKYPSKALKVYVPVRPRQRDRHRHPHRRRADAAGASASRCVVENKPGAFGIIAIEEMARAKPDGYTLKVGNPGTNVLTPIIYKKKFKIDYDKDVVHADTARRGAARCLPSPPRISR